MTSLSDGLVKLEQIVRPLEWRKVEGTEAETAYGAGTAQYTMMYTSSEGGWRVYGIEGNSDGAARYPTDLIARAAAEADYRARITSALNLDPLLSEIKRMKEALGRIAQGSADISDTAIIISPGTVMAASELLSHIRALSTLSPQEPDNG